jgi:group I intron endonuclease
MNNNIGIYLLRNTVTNKVYVGASTNLERRKGEFLAGRGYRATMLEAMKEFHPSVWTHEILCTCPKSALDICERFYINMYKSADPRYGYNISLGGAGMFGVKHSEKAKKKMSDNSSRPWLGKHLSGETKKKISESLLGEKNPRSMLGKFGAEHNRSKAINQYDKQMNFIRRWESMSDVQRELGINQSSITKCCRGKCKSAGGYCWAYADAD